MFIDAFHRGDRLEIVDVVMLSVAGKLASSIQVPTSLDELLDMTVDVLVLQQFLCKTGIDVTLHGQLARFVPYLRKDTLKMASRGKLVVSQSDVTDFPYEFALDLGTFLDQNVFVAVFPLDNAELESNQPSLELSVPDFARYLAFLRRLTELVKLLGEENADIPDTFIATNIELDGLLCGQIQQHTCRICMDNEEDIVLPCMHGLCRLCAQKWVDVHQDCPFCRQRYPDQKRMERNQWQFESLEGKDVEADIANMQSRVQSFLVARRENRAVTWQAQDDFVLIGKSLHEIEIEDSFILIN